MGWDREREARKRGEILQSVTRTLQAQNIDEADTKKLAEAILLNFVQTSPPEEENHTMQLIVVGRMGRGGGRSTKPGNIRLNIGKLIEAIASGVLTTAGAFQLPFTAPFAALLVLRSLLNSIQVSITETEGCVLYVMWVYKNQDREVEKSTLLKFCNELLDKYEKPLLTQGVLNESLSALQKIRAIEISHRNSTMWWLREQIQVPYR